MHIDKIIFARALKKVSLATILGGNMRTLINIENLNFLLELDNYVS